MDSLIRPYNEDEREDDNSKNDDGRLEEGLGCFVLVTGLMVGAAAYIPKVVDYLSEPISEFAYGFFRTF
jgi:hypothetical protein